MAVSVQTPIFSNSGMWHLGDSQTTFASAESDEILGTQYSPSALDSSSMIPSFHHPPLESTQSYSPARAKPTSPELKNRGSSSGFKPSKIKRSMSTPNVRGQAAADSAALALSADKRRNKLGYHRTSVACGHCRRRKIRCIPAPADSQNRCSNCIRLKKECNFYPVDQQPPIEPKRRGSKTQSGTGRASESSSPSTTSGQLSEIPSNLPFPHNMNMPPIQDLGGPQMKRPRTESFSPENKVVTSSRNFEYGHAAGATNWMAPATSPSAKTPAEVSQSFWRVNSQESPLTPAFSPFTPNLQVPPQQSWPVSHPEPSPRDDISWSVPQRSISYGNLEGLQSQQQYAPYTNPPSQAIGDHYSTKPRILHTMFPPHISSSGSTHPVLETSSASPNDPHQHPQSAGAQPYPGWQQGYSYQKPPVSGNENYGPYHGGHLPLPTESNPPGAPTYGYSEPQSGMYYPTSTHPGR